MPGRAADTGASPVGGWGYDVLVDHAGGSAARPAGGARCELAVAGARDLAAQVVVLVTMLSTIWDHPRGKAAT
jgi:hypothetical protein